MNLCVVTRNPETYFIKRLIAEVGDSVGFYDPWSKLPLPTASLYLMRTTGVYRDDRDLECLKAASGQIINSLSCLQLHRQKSTQYQFWDSHHIPVLRWQRASDEPLPLKKFIVKPDRGQGGWGIRLLSDKEWGLWWQERQREQDTDYLFQEWGEGVEFRVFFIRDRQWVLKRESDNGVANFAAGGSAVAAELPLSVRAQLNSVIQLSGAHYGAIDLIVLKNGRPTFLELNTAPGIEQLEAVTGENIMKALLSSLGISRL